MPKVPPSPSPNIPGIAMRAMSDMDEDGRPGAFELYAPNEHNKGEIYFICPNGRRCGVPIRNGEPANTGTHRWGFDGNVVAPTIKPSINCNGPSGCGWHGFISAGRLTNA